MKKKFLLPLFVLLAVAVSAQTLTLGVSAGGGGWAFPKGSSTGGVTTGNGLKSILNRYLQINAEAQIRGPWHLASSLRYEQRYYDSNDQFGYGNQVVTRLILPLEMRWHYRDLSVGVGGYGGYRIYDSYTASLNKRPFDPTLAFVDCICYYVPINEDRRINAGITASIGYRPRLTRNLRALIEYNPSFDLNTSNNYDGTRYRALNGTLGLLFEVH